MTKTSLPVVEVVAQKFRGATRDNSICAFLHVEAQFLATLFFITKKDLGQINLVSLEGFFPPQHYPTELKDFTAKYILKN